MKKIFCIFCVFLSLISVQVYADGFDDVLDSEMRDNIENAFEASGVEIDAIDIINKLNNGDFNIGVKNIGTYIKNILGDLLKENVGFGLTAFILIMLASIIENMNQSFNENKTINLIIMAVVVLSLTGVINSISEYSVQFIDNLILFINSLTPTLMLLLASSGKTGTAGVLNPVMIGVSSVIVLFVKSFVVPLNTISLVLKLTGCITDKNHLTNFGNQIQKILKWALGLVFTIYVGIIGVVGVAAPKVDDIAVKTAKYAISNFIPYVGGMAADSVELILNCSSVVKNSVGIAGLICILLIAAIPCLKILVKLIVINILGFFVSPIAGKNIMEVINSISSGIGILFAMNIVVSIMYIISVTVIICIGGA